MAAKYVRAVGGNWTADATWSTTSGGAADTVAPTAADDCFADASSGQITLDANGVCRSLNCTGYTGTFTHSASPRLTIGDATAGASNVALKFVAGMTYTNNGGTVSLFDFVSTSSTQQTIDFADKTTGAAVSFSGTGSSYLFSSGFTATGAAVTQTRGTVNYNGQTFTWGRFDSNNANTRTITLGAANITITLTAGDNWNVNNSTGLTLSAGISTITLNGAASRFQVASGQTYGSIYMTGSGAMQISQVSCGLLSRTGTAAKTDSLSISGNITASGTFEMLGNSGINRLLLQSTTVGTPRTITAGGTNFANLDVQDITAAGGGNWDMSAISGYSGDCGGNTGITFTTPTTKTWNGTSGGNWSTNTWSGTGVPLPQDTANLGKAFSASQTITADMPRLGGSINFTGATGTPAFNLTVNCAVYGSLTFISAMTATGNFTMTFSGRSSFIFTSAGVVSAQSYTVGAFGGTLTLGDALTAKALTFTAGDFVTSNFNITLNNGFSSFLSSGATTRSITLGTSTIAFSSTTIQGTPVSFGASTGMTVSAASSTISFTGASPNTRIFTGGGFTWGTVDYTVAGSTGELDILGASTFQQLNFSDASNARTLKLEANKINTFVNTNGFNVQGTSGKLMTVTSTTGVATTITSSNQQSCDYLNLTNVVVDASPKWYAGANSTDNGGNTNWIFTAPSAGVNGTSYFDLEYAAYAIKTGLSGITLDQQKLVFYNSQLGTNYNSVDEAEIAFLKNKTSLPTVNFRDQLWRSYLVGRGVTFQLTLRDMKLHFFKAVGFA